MVDSSKVILIVEDEPLIRMCAVEMAEEAGYDVLEAANAEAARDLFARHPDISVLFTDINLPGPIDGAQLAQEIAADRPDMRIVIASGKPPPETLRLSPKVVFLPKPYGSRQLVDVLEGAGD